jgi:tetratricopeptide (TPR) repeat protein
LQTIGAGGMGAVFLAEQQQPVRRTVALKVIKPGMDSGQVLARFEAERQALALMDHPNIARVLDAGTTDSGRPYFVMELVKGTPITKYCDEHRLTPRERLELFIPVCQAIQHAHQKGVIHRDVKPSNVLVAPYDGKPVVKVIDFGVAKAAGQRLTERTLVTGFGAVVGTLEYMSPEQAELNNQDIDTRSDVYSLGVLLYELLTGSTPLTKQRIKETPFPELLRLIREEEPPRPSTRLSATAEAPSIAANRGMEPAKLRGLVRGELDWIVMRALEKDRNRRYEAAAAFAADVQRYLHDEPVLACPPSAWYRFRKFARRNKTALALAFAALLVVAAVAGAVGWVVRDREARRSAAGHEAGAALRDARQLQDQGKWPEALEEAKRAEGPLAGFGGLEDLRQQARQIQADSGMVAKLDEARLQRAAFKDGHFDSSAAEVYYQAAFQSYGLDLATLDPDEAAARMRASVIREHLLAAVTDWYTIKPKTDKAGMERLRAIAVSLEDADDWRRRFRDLGSRGDRKGLEKLAAEPAILEQPPAALVSLAKALFKTGAQEAAIDLLKRAQRQHPGNLWLNHELACQLCFSRQPRPAEAIGHFRVVLALRPQSPGALNNLAIALFYNGQLPEAVAHYQRAIALQDDYADAHRNLGLALQRQGKWEEAIVEYGKAIERKPDSALAYCTLGGALRTMKRLDDAAAAYRKAIDLLEASPEPPGTLAAEALCNLGIVVQEQGEVPKAVEAYQKAIALNPDFAEAHYSLGIALGDLGKLAEAEASYRKTIAIKPDFAEAHCNLGGVLRRQQRFPESLAEYRRGHELGARRADWRYPSAQWVRDGEVLVALDEKLAAIQRGTAQPADAAERLTLAEFCVARKHLPVLAARFCTEAFAADPPLSSEKKAVHLYNAACAAALAGNGQGEDAAQLDEKERARWRRQALEWLQLALAVWTERAEKGTAAQRGAIFGRMQYWQRDADLAGIREETALARLADSERQAWRKFWADVEALRSRLKPKGKEPPPKNP